MRKLILPVIAVVALSGCEPAFDPTSPMERNFSAHGGSSSTGHYSVDFGAAFIEKYSYSAVLQPNGSVKGQFQVQGFDASGHSYIVHGETTCLTILPDGRTARMGGVITKATGAAITGVEPGQEAAWIVRDNGEGQDPNDLASDIRFGFPAELNVARRNCNTGLQSIFLRGLTDEGNIQVRP